jgi:hypothetical protein
MEGPAAKGTEVVPFVIVAVEWAHTPLFLRDLDLVEMPFINEASESESGEDPENSSGSNSDDNSNGSVGAMHMDDTLQ